MSASSDFMQSSLGQFSGTGTDTTDPFGMAPLTQLQDSTGLGINDPVAGGGTQFQTPNISGANFTSPQMDFSGGGTTGSNVLQGLTGVLGSNMGGLLGGSNVLQMAGMGGMAAMGLSQAQGAQQQAAGYAQQLQGPANQFLAGSQQQLSQFQSGKLRPDQQAYIGDLNGLASSIQDQNSNLSQIISTNFGDYASGTLKPADQTALDQQTAAAKTAMRQQMVNAGIKDSSIMQAYDQQIDTQAQMQKQQVLNSYFTTGDQAYNSWLNGTAEGAALKTTAANYAQTAFQDMMQNTLGLGSLGMSGLSQSIALQVQSDEALGQQVSQLMQNLMSAFAYSVAGGGRGGMGGGGMGGVGMGGAQGGSWLQQITGYGNLANNVANDAGLYGSAASGVADAGSLASSSDAAVNAAMDASGGASDLGSLGGSFSSAGGQAATSGIGVAGAASLGLGAIGAGYGAYNTYNQMAAGNTGGAALSGAETGMSTGAMIGSVVPGIGTAVGAVAGLVIGGAVGAIGSLFGSKTDPEVHTFDNIINIPNKQQGAQAAMHAPDKYLVLAGLFDEKNIHTNIPIYALYGRGGEQRFANDMTSWIEGAYKNHQIGPQDNAFTVFQKIVQPQISKMAIKKGINPVMQDPNAGIIDATMIGMVNDYMTGNTRSWKAVGGDNPFANIQRYG